MAVKKEGNQISSLFPLHLSEGENVTISVVLPDGTVPTEEFVERKAYKEDEETEEYKKLVEKEESINYEWISLMSGTIFSWVKIYVPYCFLATLLYLVYRGCVIIISNFTRSKS